MKQVRPRIGLLALTLELYNQLAPDLKRRREEWIREAVVPALQVHADVDFPGIVGSRQAIASAVSHFESERMDGMLILLATYSPSLETLPALQRTSLPLLVWNTQDLYAVDALYDNEKMFHNHGVHGTQDLCCVLTRENVAFEYVTSHMDDANATAEIADWFAAVGATRALRQARVGLIGYPFPGMGDFAIDADNLRAALGCEWVQLSVEDYINGTSLIESRAVTSLAAEYKKSYTVDADITAPELEATARAELALRRLVYEYQLDALTYQFMAFGEDERSETLPFVGASRLMAEGLGFAGEGDVLGAAGCRFLYLLQPPATFSEMFTIDFAGNAVLMSHMGESNVGMAPPGRLARMAARATPITRTRQRQLTFSTGITPGPVTLSALALGSAGQPRIIASRMEVIEFAPLDTLEVPHFKLRPKGDVRDFLTTYAKAGGPHHNALCFGDARRRLAFAARLLDINYTEV